MGIKNTGKLKNLLDVWPPQTVATSAWLHEQKVSAQLAQRYVRSHWIEPLGTGAFKRPNEKVEWFGAVRSLQTQLDLAVHIGALTALSAQGFSHYLRMGQEPVYLFSPPDTRLPSWFTGYDWKVPIHHVKSILLPENVGLTRHAYGSLDVTISAPERAILECLHLSPKRFDLIESYELLQGLLNLRPKLMQELLEVCNSIKVKRLFLYMAAKASLPVIKHLNLDTIDLGKGDRSLTKDGLYVSKYALNLPKELVNHD